MILIVISEFLATLGLQDNFSTALDNAMKKGEESVGKWRGATAKQFAMAGVAVAGFLAMAAAGIFKFAKHLMASDDEVNRLAQDLGVSREEAFATKSALDAMGKSLEEIQADPKLLQQFESLKTTAEQIRPPDFSEGLSSVRDFAAELTKTKQIAMMGLQWIGHYFLKHVQKPMENLRGMLKGLNGGIVKAMPKISEGIGKAMAWVVRLGTRIIQGAQQIWKVATRLLDMVPDKLKGIGVALFALNKILAMGPLGIFIALITAALLLLDDFYTYLEGGDALLTPVWEALTGLFSGFEESGKSALEWFSQDFLPGLLELGVGLIKQIIQTIVEQAPGIIMTVGQVGIQLLDALLGLLPSLLDAGAEILLAIIDGIVEALPALLEVGMTLLEKLLDAILNNLPKIIDAGIRFILSLVQGIVKALPKIIQAATNLLNTLIQYMVENLPDLIQMGIDMVLALVSGLVDALPEIITAILNLLLSIQATIIQNMPQIIMAGIKILLALVQGLLQVQDKIREAIGKVVLKLFEALKTVPDRMKEAGKGFIRNLVEGILSMGSWLKEKVGGFVGGIVDGFKNTFGGGGEPQPAGGGISSVPLAGGHTEGGIFDQPHVSPFAEGGKLEAVVPLTKPQRAREIIDKSEQFLGGASGSNLAPLMEKGIALLERMASGMENILAVYSGLQAVPAVASGGNVYNTYNNKVESKIDVHGSGDPERTARHVDKNQHTLIRNLNGMGV